MPFIDPKVAMLSLNILIQAGLVFALIIVLNFVVRLVIKKIYAQVKHAKGDVLDESFIDRLAKPLRALIWLVGLSYIGYIFVTRLNLIENFNDGFEQWRNLVIVFCISWLSFEIKKQFQLSMVKSMHYSGKHLDQTRIDLISKLGSILIVFLTIMVILQTLGVDLTAIVAFGGVGGVALGFASKDIIANYFSGFMIHITRPFKVGDWIYTPDKSLNGTVEYIGYYTTVVRNFEKQPYYVPNALFSSKMVINASRMTNRRVKHLIGIRYQDFGQLENIVNDIRTMLQNHPHMDTKQLMLVDFIEYGPHSLNIQIYAFTKTTVWKMWLSVQQDVLIQVGKIIEKYGAEIAFPTSTVDFSTEVLNQIVPPPAKGK